MPPLVLPCSALRPCRPSLTFSHLPRLNPTQQNPAYKGKWFAPMIDNPKYKGEWKPKEIPNPDHVKDPAPLTNIGKVRAETFSPMVIGIFLGIENQG